MQTVRHNGSDLIGNSNHWSWNVTCIPFRYLIHWGHRLRYTHWPKLIDPRLMPLKNPFVISGNLLASFPGLHHPHYLIHWRHCLRYNLNCLLTSLKCTKQWTLLALSCEHPCLLFLETDITRKALEILPWVLPVWYTCIWSHMTRSSRPSPILYFFSSSCSEIARRVSGVNLIPTISPQTNNKKKPEEGRKESCLSPPPFLMRESLGSVCWYKQFVWNLDFE